MAAKTVAPVAIPSFSAAARTISATSFAPPDSRTTLLRPSESKSSATRHSRRLRALMASGEIMIF